MGKLTENEVNNLLDIVADIPDTLSVKLIKYMKRVKNAARTLKRKIEELEDAYFGIGNKDKKNNNEKGMGDFNTISHDILNRIDEALPKTMDFVAKL